MIIAPYGKGNVTLVCAGRAAGDRGAGADQPLVCSPAPDSERQAKAIIANPLPRNKVVLAVSVLLLLIFSKYFYMASISSYYTFI